MKLSGRAGRLRFAGAALGVAVVGAAVGVVLVRSLHGEVGSGRDDPGIDPADVLSDEQLELIHRAEPDPACASEPTPVPADDSLVPMDVVRVEGTCLDAATEYVPADRVDARRAELARDPTVIAADVVPLASPDQVDDRRDDQWALDALGVPEGSTELPWPDGEGVVVAVVDTGVDDAHPDLEGAVVDRRHYPGEAALDAEEEGHGTQVAGVIAARRDHGGVLGVAPAASILDVPVHLKGAEENPDSPWVGLAWAVNHGADVANLSFNGSLAEYTAADPDDMHTLVVAIATVRFALDHDVVVVTGAGNCGNHGNWEKCPEANQREVPAVVDGVVAVGAVDHDFRLAGYSTRNDNVALVAPGAGEDPKILTTGPGRELVGFHGTSAAAPHVAAAAAVLRAEDPDATAGEVRTALVESADPGRVHEDDRSDVGAGRGFLDIRAAIDHLRSSPAPPADDDLAAATQAAFVQDGTLFAFDGTTAEPVRPIDPATPVTWLEWSADHTRLAGSTATTLFAWAGPGTEPVEIPYQQRCEVCGPDLAFLDDTSRPGAELPGDVVARMEYDSTTIEYGLIEYDALTLQELGTIPLSFPDDAPGDKTLHGDVGGRLVVHESGGAHASERIWLVDPVSREAQVSHEVSGQVLGPVAVDAADERIAFVAGYSECSEDNHVYVLDGEDLHEIAAPAAPPGVVVDELFFNGDTLYATMTSPGPGPGALQTCAEGAAAGIWRLDGDTWDQVRSVALLDARPLEGRFDDAPAGWLVVESDGRASVRPSERDDYDLGDLGVIEPGLWSTPTHDEVDFGPAVGGGDNESERGGPGDGEGDGGGTGDGTGDDEESPPGTGSASTAPATVEAAVARFEEFVHALGAGDVGTACAIGRVAVEAGGEGLSCEEAVQVLVEMSPESELAALREVTVDPGQVTQTAPDRVEIPPAPPYSTDPASDPPVIMEHDGTNWFVLQ